MRTHFMNKTLILLALVGAMTSCIPKRELRQENPYVPDRYTHEADTSNMALQPWKSFFDDPALLSLIDSALAHNQELNILRQEVEMSRNDIMEKKGELLPKAGIKLGAGVEKTGRYTPQGAMEATTEIEPGREMPDPVPDFQAVAVASWEIDVWKKLRNSKKAAIERYLASQEGQNFMVTQLIAEIAHSYYELLSLDYQLYLIESNIEIQKNALMAVRLQKTSAKVNELAVKRFEAQVYKTTSLRYEVMQEIVETENKLHFLTGSFPRPIVRDFHRLDSLAMDTMSHGIPSQLLLYRPDIRKAEHELAAARLDVKSARARFLPSVGISAGIGLQAFNPAYVIQTPQSLIYQAVGDMMAPLINRKAIKAAYFNATNRQIQAAYAYEEVILKGYLEVYNQINLIQNLEERYNLQKSQVEALTESVDISNSLFRSARADYMEVLLTQREALESTMDLIETRKKQASARVSLYQTLGGGWVNP